MKIEGDVTVLLPKEKGGKFTLILTLRYQDRNGRACSGRFMSHGRDEKEALIDLESDFKQNAHVVTTMVTESVHRLNKAGKGFRDEPRPNIEDVFGGNAAVKAPAANAPAEQAPPSESETPKREWKPISEKMKQQELVELAIEEGADLPQPLKHNTAKAVIIKCIQANRVRIEANPETEPMAF
jgi:hypothetical protein